MFQAHSRRLQETVVSVIIVFILDFFAFVLFRFLLFRFSFHYFLVFVLVFVNENHTAVQYSLDVSCHVITSCIPKSKVQ